MDLNRSLLERQMLTQPWRGGCLEVIERLVGVQAQVPSPPYFGLWARLQDFSPEALMALRDEKQVYRAPLLRSTLHWVSAADYYWMRPTIQPALERAWQGFFGKRKDGIEVAPLCAAARELLKPGSISLGDLSTALLREFPDWNREAMEYGVRTHLPLVQVSPAGAWKGGVAAKYELAPVAAEADPRRLVRRYLAAFGPATARDAAAWAGYSGLGATVKAMREELTVSRGAQGEELFDVPDGAKGGELPAVKFVAEYDNLVLAHADRSRVLPEAVRKRVLLTAGRVLATVLLEGVVGGVWKLERGRAGVTLRVELFVEPPARRRKQVESEGERLLQWAEPAATAREIALTW